jgi:NUMOD4 motif/HNH endonuclease
VMHRNYVGATKEEWRSIDGYALRYEVSSLGRVRSLDRIDAAGNKIKGRILKPRVHSGGYVRVNLCDGRARDFFIHRLVLEAFRGPCPQNMEGCHNDGDKQNNTLTNLRWDTCKENSADKKLHGTQPVGDLHYTRRRPEWVRRGGRASGAMLNLIDVERIRDLGANGCTYAAISTWIGATTETNIGLIIRRVSWRHA